MRQLHFFTVLLALLMSPLASLAAPVLPDISNTFAGTRFLPALLVHWQSS